MKKILLAFTILSTLGLTACSLLSFNFDEDNKNVYYGEILFSADEGDDLKLTIRKNNCESTNEKGELVTVLHKYDSNLVVGSCVRVSMNEDGTSINNISRSRSSSVLSRTAKY